MIRLNPRKCRGLTLALGLSVSTATVTHAQTITQLPTFGPPPSGEDYATPYACSFDGSVVVGFATSPGGPRAFRWTQAGGLQNLGLLPGTTEARAFDVSNDGNVIVGEAMNGATPEPFRWTSTGGLVSMGIPGGRVIGVSADGLVAAGTMAVPNVGGFWRWTTTGGFQNIGVYPGTQNTEAFGLSPDGSTIVGRAGLGVFGPTNHAVKWSVTGGWVDLGVNGSGNFARGLAASNDGSYVVGEANFPFPTFIHAVRWNGAVLEDTGIPSNAQTVTPLCVSSDGSVLAGTIFPMAGATHSYLWCQTFQFEETSQYLVDRGVNIGNWNFFYEIRGISGDNTALVGWGRDNFVARGFVVRGLPPVCGPRITEPPQNQIGCVGGVVTMFCDAFGPNLHSPQFQWQKRGTDGEWNDLPNHTTPQGTIFSGTNTPMITISNCHPSVVPGLYRCMVTAGCASRASASAMVSLVSGPPVFSSHPTNTNTCPGDSAVFNAGPPLGANGPFTYEWQRETFPNSGVYTQLFNGFTYSWDGNVAGYGGIVSGATTPTLTIAPDTGNGRILGPAHSRMYRCIVINPCAATLGNPAGLKAFTSCLMGDANCDGMVSVGDIGFFVMLLTNPGGYEAQNPNCNPENGDLNQDNLITVSDIGPFVNLLTGG